MKKILLFITPIICLGIVGIFFMSNDTQMEVVAKTPQVLSMVRSIDVPEKVKFAGEEVELNRYDLHERFDREINGFSYLHSTTLLLLKKANRYFPLIEPILKENDIPEDFKYLAVIESNLNDRALSPAKAAGLWQLMQGTAKDFGLEVSTEVDERYSVEKSTIAACKYLRQAYQKYGSWASVALSYNAGQGRISGELDKQQAGDGLDLWLVEETSRYYFRMLAIKQIFEAPDKYGFVLKPEQLYKPIAFTVVNVNYSITELATFAKDNNVTYAQLKDFNPWLRDRKLTITPKSQKSYKILIPKEESLYYNKGDVKVHDKKWIMKD